jgi:hypothetical protein
VWVWGGPCGPVGLGKRAGCAVSNERRRRKSRRYSRRQLDAPKPETLIRLDRAILAVFSLSPWGEMPMMVGTGRWRRKQTV